MPRRPTTRIIIVSVGIPWLAGLVGIALGHYYGPYWPTLGATYIAVSLACKMLRSPTK